MNMKIYAGNPGKKYDYLEINRLEDKNGKKLGSVMHLKKYRTFNPATDLL